MSLDSVPDNVPLSDLDMLRAKYRLDDKGVEAIQLIMKSVPLADLSSLITDDWFVRKLVPLIEDGEPMVKLRGLELLMKWLSQNKKKVRGKKINLGSEI